MLNYNVTGVLVSLLPFLKDNNIESTNVIDLKNLRNKATIDKNVLYDWIEDPYYTIIFTNNTKIISFVNRAICRIYIDRPEYKYVDSKTDLILTKDMLDIFLSLFRKDGNVYSYMDNIIDETNEYLLSNYDIEIKVPYIVPPYYRLPLLWGNTITYLMRGAKDLYE